MLKLKNNQKLINLIMQRYWINQPSSLQTFHHLDRTNVLADIKPGQKTTTIYFTDGKIISQEIMVSCLAKGWTTNKTTQMLIGLEWSIAGHSMPSCPCCKEGLKYGHSKDCQLAIYLTRSGVETQ